MPVWAFFVAEEKTEGIEQKVGCCLTYKRLRKLNLESVAIVARV
jgi:hypothetical protein